MKRPSDRPTTLIITAAAVLAAGVTAYQLTRPGLLFGITPDISAWLGGSIRLVRGALPYRDFDLTQPPGFALLASPFAFLSQIIGTRDALAALRLCTPLLAAANVVLIGRLVRHHGRAAVITACAVMAFFPLSCMRSAADCSSPSSTSSACSARCSCSTGMRSHHGDAASCSAASCSVSPAR